MVAGYFQPSCNVVCLSTSHGGALSSLESVYTNTEADFLMLASAEGEKPKEYGEKPSERGGEPTTNSTYILELYLNLNFIEFKLIYIITKLLAPATSIRTNRGGGKGYTLNTKER